MNIDKFFDGKNILITGGTGSIGSEILRFLASKNVASVKIFSRNEYKQYQLRLKYDKNKKIKFILGDVRDLESLIEAAAGTDMIFHCAALKHVPTSEEMPEEYIKTNILGSLNVKKAAEKNNVKLLVAISSDKAVNPSNLMGFTKAVQEKIFISHHINYNDPERRFVNVRFGNVIGTQGSLFPIMYHQLVNKEPITVTHPEMTRFFMCREEMIDLITWAAMNAKDGEIVIKKMKSVKISDLASRFIKYYKKENDYPVVNIGVRVGEKIDESLITENEVFRAKESDAYHVVMPYSELNIRENLINGGQQKINGEMEKFYSNNKSNFMTPEDIDCYIKKFDEERVYLNDLI